MQFPIIARLDCLEALFMETGDNSLHQAIEAYQPLQLTGCRNDGQLINAARAHHLNGFVDGTVDCGGNGMSELQFRNLSLVHRNLVGDAFLLLSLAVLAG